VAIFKVFNTKKFIVKEIYNFYKSNGIFVSRNFGLCKGAVSRFQSKMGKKPFTKRLGCLGFDLGRG
jgi:hypothetical protein